MGVATKERIEQRACSCGTMVNFRIVSALRGEEIALSVRDRHNAPCGRVCFESQGVTMNEVVTGSAHHMRRCECLKQGRGYT